MKAEQLARLFHETYERLAPDFGYETRKASAKPWEDVPKNNKDLMVAVAAYVLTAIESKRETDAENEKYNLPCPYNAEVMCIQMPCEPEDDNYCDDGCPNRKKESDHEVGL